ncbi:MAG: hypothetical protein ACAI35_04630 [Candidatus Methylacidiphilales bacterium]|nr:hypothetical protein [Candidatus Methylacidiphilales bacterium]
MRYAERMWSDFIEHSALNLCALAFLGFMIYRLWKAKEQKFVIIGLCIYMAYIFYSYVIDIIDPVNISVTSASILIGYFVATLAVAENDHI